MNPSLSKPVDKIKFPTMILVCKLRSLILNFFDLCQPHCQAGAPAREGSWGHYREAL